MLPADENVIFWIAVAVQCLGIASMIFARVSERCWARSLCQSTFLLCLFAVGLATAATLYLGNGNWHPCAMTLGFMCVGGTVDLGSQRTAHSF